jgi:transposase
VRGLGLPVRCLLTAGQRHDITQAKALIDGLPAQWVLGDTAFDADHFRADIEAINAQAVIPSNPSRALKLPLDKHIYKERHLVECCFNKLKHFRRIATRYEKTSRKTSLPSSPSQPSSCGSDECQQDLAPLAQSTDVRLRR